MSSVFQPIQSERSAVWRFNWLEVNTRWNSETAGSQCRCRWTSTKWRSPTRSPSSRWTTRAAVTASRWRAPKTSMICFSTASPPEVSTRTKSTTCTGTWITGLPFLSSDRIPAPTFHSLIGYRPLAIKSSWPIKVSLEAVTKKCRCYVETPVNVAPFFRNLFSFCYDTIYLVMYLINCGK